MDYILCIILFIAGISLSAISGHDPWRDWGDNTYFISDHLDLRLNYTQASQYCQNRCGHLTSVLSQEEKEFLRNNKATVSNDVWIGLHQRQTNISIKCACNNCPDTGNPPSFECETCASCRGADKWQWEDGSQYNWTNWDNSQPSHFDTEKCGRMFNYGKWFDRNCSSNFYFICKKAPPKQDTTEANSNGLQRTEAEGTTQPTLCEMQKESSAVDNTRNIVIALAVVLGISVLGNLLVVFKLVLFGRKIMQPNTSDDTHVYYNSQPPSQIKPVGNNGRQVAGHVNEYSNSCVAEGESPNSKVLNADLPYEDLVNREEDPRSRNPVTYEKLK